MQAFYEALKAVSRPSHQIQAPRLFGGKYPADRQGSHPPAPAGAFRRPLQRPTPYAGVFTGQVPQVDVKLELDDPPTREEIKNATMQLKVGKSPGIDGIPAEVYQHGGEAVLDKLQDLFTNCWEEGTVLQDLRDEVIVSLYKKKKHTHTKTKKGEKSDSSSCQGITVLSAASQILARVSLNTHPDDNNNNNNNNNNNDT